jgi:hypothetical protein
MAYSRWSKSRWYSYWEEFNAKSDEFISNHDKKCLENLVLWDKVSEEFNFTFKEVWEDEDSCIDVIKSKTTITEREEKEIKSIIKRFIIDVKEYYSGK